MSARDRALLLTLTLALSLDQLTKAAVVWGLAEGVDAIVLIDGWLSIVHVRNHAAAFGMTGDLSPLARRILYAVSTFAMLGGLAFMRTRLPRADRLAGVMLGLAAGGVLGNALDRLFRGSVVDMVQMTAAHPALGDPLRQLLGTHTWPVYNVADAVLLFAACAFAAWLIAPEEPPEAADPSGAG